MTLLPRRRFRYGAILATAGLVAALTAGWRLWDYPLWVSFHLDPHRPYHIDLGRGSRALGLDTIRVEQDGTVTLHRRWYTPEVEDYWQMATLHLPPEGMEEVLAAVEDTRVLGLGGEYHDPFAADGTQWVLWVSQGAVEVAVHCDGRFPGPAERFARRLDAVLAAHGLGTVEWQRAPDGQQRQHEQELWKSLKQ